MVSKTFLPQEDTQIQFHTRQDYQKKTHTLCNMIATNTITSTSVFDVVTAAPRATPSATEKKVIIKGPLEAMYLFNTAATISCS